MSINKPALLNVVKALRETPFPEKFDMKRHVHPCGTPACAFGNYAARTDLQNQFELDKYRNNDPFYGVVLKGTETDVQYFSESVLEHFGITEVEADELFGTDMDSMGEDDSFAALDRACSTAEEAAAYIEAWVTDHE